MRAKSNAPRFRQERISRAIRRRIASATRRGFQIVQFSIQQNHLHLVVEADDRKLLWKGIQRLAQRLAWDINALAHRHGSLWRDRYTRRDLTSPRQVRNALVYVLMNFRKHAIDEVDYALASMTLDPCSSAFWFDGWDTRAGPLLAALRRELEETNLLESPVSRARTWLLRAGWKRHGLMLATEHPRLAG
ncbi:transposase [Labilithrix luteola]